MDYSTADGGFLHRGKLTAKVPAGAAAFRVGMPGMTVTDVGGECGLLRDEAGLTEVHVFATHGVLCGPAIERLRDSPIKQVVIKGVPDRSTRLAMLRTGEADIGYLMVGEEAADIRDNPKLRLAKATGLMQREDRALRGGVVAHR